LKNKKASIEVFDTDGKLVENMKITFIDDFYTFDFSKKPNGNYFVKITADEKNYKGRFVKISK